MIVKIDNKEDREQLALILIKNGYIVSIAKKKEVGKSKFDYFVNFEKGGDKNGI